MGNSSYIVLGSRILIIQRGLVSEIAAGRGADVARAATSENEQFLLW